MPTKINRSSGITDSERYLAKLAEETFLKVWSYPNTFKDDGKEHADLLVVCGDDVVIFSDKDIGWPQGSSLGVQWRRWYKRAITKSVDQIRGAERWLRNFPDRVFLDPAATMPLPVRLPPPDRMRVHGVAVVRGIKEACKAHHGGSGSLGVLPRLRGAMHTDLEAPDHVLFAIGDIDPDQKTFIHVLDEVTLDIVSRLVDTVTDLTQYLLKKEAFVRSGKLTAADGEEELLALFLTRMRGDEHDFVKENGLPFGPSDEVVLRGGFKGLMRDPQFRAKIDADEISYLWDRLIDEFGQNMLDGTSVVPAGRAFEFRDAELALRHMAIVPRYMRRMYAEKLIEARDIGSRADRFGRVIVNSVDRTAFVFFTLRPDLFKAADYDRYRAVRIEFMKGYAFKTLRDLPEIEQVVAIGVEPIDRHGKWKGGSEDLLYVPRPEWTPEILGEVATLEEKLGILVPERVVTGMMGADEYPDVSPSGLRSRPPGWNGQNRMARRAAMAKERHRR